MSEELQELFQLLFYDNLTIFGKRKLKEEVENLQQRIVNAIVFLAKYKNEWEDNDEVINDLNCLLSILKGENKE